MAQEDLSLICDRPMETYPMIHLFCIGVSLVGIAVDMTLFQALVLMVLSSAFFTLGK